MRLIILFIIFSMGLWYFHIDVNGFVNAHPQIKTSFETITSFLSALWHNYLSNAMSYIWNDVIIDIVWKNISPLFAKMKG